MNPVSAGIQGLILLFFLFFSSACALFSGNYPLSDARQVEAAYGFRAAMVRQNDCSASLDAQVQVSLKSVILNGTISGFVQALTPSYLKLIAVNPLGQPALFLLSDGNRFRYLSVPEAVAWEGPVSAAAFRKYAPPGFDPRQAYYWLTGRLAPEALRIFSVAEDKDGLGLWLEFAYETEILALNPLRRRILFEPGRELIRRHVVSDQAGKVLLDVWYDDFVRFWRDERTPCRLPGRVRIGDKVSMMDFTFSDWLLDASFKPGDFNLALPPGVTLIPVD